MKRLGAALVFLLAPGCYSKITAHEGRLTFGYAASVQIENFVKPIAPGAKLDLHAFAHGESERLPIVSATSSAPGVLRVVSASDETVVVLGIAPGVAEITIEARSGGAVTSDRMFFHVARPSKHGLEHACFEGERATYVRGQDVTLFHDLATSDGRHVIGRDYLPLAFEPSGALELVSQPQAGGLYRFRSVRAGEASVTSTVDAKRLVLNVVEPAAITRATLAAPTRLLAGEVQYVAAEVEHDSGPVCTQDALTRARSLTPATCRVTAKLEDSVGEENRWQLARVTALAFGTCELEVTLPELGGGRGLTLRQSIAIGRAEYPGDRTSTIAKWIFGLLAFLLASRAAVFAGVWAFRRRR